MDLGDCDGRPQWERGKKLTMRKEESGPALCRDHLGCGRNENDDQQRKLDGG